ncbi:hypothetical protein G6F24_017038 [Rhizopus arrhizus]|nr:hypothetical protein G6F24_017038 [Rhizopus arrhizus]
MARFAPLGFSVAEETMALMREVAASGELDALVPERVWQELRKALACERPSAFLRTLHDAHALGPILPELEALKWSATWPRNWRRGMTWSASPRSPTTSARV